MGAGGGGDVRTPSLSMWRSGARQARGRTEVREVVQKDHQAAIQELHRDGVWDIRG